MVDKTLAILDGRGLSIRVCKTKLGLLITIEHFRFFGAPWEYGTDRMHVHPKIILTQGNTQITQN